jgi:glutamyl-tRNA synthetase
MVRFLAELPEYDLEIYTHKKMKTDVPVSLEALQMMKPVLENVSDWTETSIHGAVMAAIEASGKKNGAVLWPLRIAISGQANTPGGAIEIAYLLGKAETLRRVENGIGRLGKA